MRSWLQKNSNLLLLMLIYLLVLLQYPTGVAISQLFFKHDLITGIAPSALLLWGVVRVGLILPLVYTLVLRLRLDKEKIFMPVRSLERTTAVTFWLTLGFVLLGVFLYPFFLRVSTLSILGVITNLPIFLAYAVTNAYVEETFFRGLLVTQLSRKLPFVAVNIIQATLFMAIHLISPFKANLLAFVLLTWLLGLLWGYVTKKTGSILPAIVMHVIADIFVAVSLF